MSDKQTETAGVSPSTRERLRRVKASFRMKMNGVASHSMRVKGVDYKINWGVGLPDLRAMAAEYGEDAELATELWKENIRECKILATMIMPPAAMSRDKARLWVSQVPNQEIAEIASMCLFQHVGDAKALAFDCLLAERDYERACGYQVLSRLLARGETLSADETDALLSRARQDLEGGNMAVRHAAANTLKRYSMLGDECLEAAKKVLGPVMIDIF